MFLNSIKYHVHVLEIRNQAEVINAKVDGLVSQNAAK